MSDRMSNRIAEIMAAKVRKQRAEIERQRNENARLRADAKVYSSEIEKLRGALRWYGDRACALSGEDNKHPFSDLFEDAGALARETLEAKP